MRAFRKLSSVDPTIVELREWSRIDEELKAEHVRLTNRLKHQLWRYYPQIYELANDVGAGWFLDLLEALPTPEKAAKTREKTVARILKQYRIRRFDAAHVLSELRKPALTVAPGTIEAATAGIRILIARLRLINSQLVDAEQQSAVQKDCRAGCWRGRREHTGAEKRAARRSDPRFHARHRQDRPGLAAHRGFRCSAEARLSCFASIVWYRPGNKAKWQELLGFA
jgi:hypothetical protein